MLSGGLLALSVWLPSAQAQPAPAGEPVNPEPAAPEPATQEPATPQPATPEPPTVEPTVSGSPLPPPADFGSAPVPPPPPAAASAEPAEVADAPEPEYAGPAAAGNNRLTLLIGSGSASNDTYLILGVGVGRFLINGLEVGIDYEAWLFGDPTFHRLSPEVRYVLFFVPKIQPYVGTFYRHTFVADQEDSDSIGARAGLIFGSGKLLLGAGAVYERQLDCTDGTLLDCDDVYPEITIGVTF